VLETDSATYRAVDEERWVAWETPDLE